MVTGPKAKPKQIISVSWRKLITFCQTGFPNGEIRLRIINCEPKILLSAKPEVRFDKADKIPTAMFLPTDDED